MTIFGRFEIGFGTQGFSGNNSLMSQAGYGGSKMWITMDGAYMFGRVGVGPWLGMSRRASDPVIGPGLNEVAYFIGVEAPILLVGKRRYALHVVPRLAFASAQLELDNDVDAPFQNAALWGGAVTFTMFRYHTGISVALMRGLAGPPGEVGRDHDYGGFYASIGGTIDG